MKYILGLLSALLLLTGCSAGSPNASYQQVEMDNAISMMAEADGWLLLDVRTISEYESGHIPGAICIPNETIGDTRPDALPDTDQLIFIYCRSGNRSKQAAQKLADLGYTNLVEIGGINRWSGELES